MFSMAGRVAIVSGGSKGIGRAIAEELARAGAAVSIAARGRASLEDTARAISSESGTVHHVAADMTDRDGIRQVVDETVERFGFVDTLVNNVGGSRGPGFQNRRLRDIDDAVFDHAFRYNVKSHLWASQMVAPIMWGRGRGSIVNIASTSGRPHLLPLSNGAVYSMAKASVVQLTISMAIEWGPTIRVNCVAPGLVRSYFSRNVTDQQQQAALSRMVMGRLGEPRDVAGAVLYLASDAASWVTGIVVDVNGGAGLRPAYEKTVVDDDWESMA
jgi:NAD(P)-dependent dehydrogenase (short-subunit alcohol dehydrogenase family)